jgi:Cu2+-exporting ATPase
LGTIWTRTSYGLWFINAIAVLIIACPCAWIGYTHVGYGWCWERSTIWSFDKNAEALENMNKVNVLITDKTGTITEGKPSVEKVFA